MTIKNLPQILVQKIKRIKLYQYLLLAILIHIILIIWFHYIMIVRPMGHKVLFRSKIISPSKRQARKAAPRRKQVVKKVPPTARKIPAKMIPAPPKAQKRIAVKTATNAIPMATLSKMADIRPKDINLAKRGRGIGGALKGLSGATGGISGSGLYGSRYGNKDGALRAYGGSDESESAVIKALEWLKNNQLPDGSWTGPNPKGRRGHERDPENYGTTGLGLMCFLGHGETHKSVRYGTTVKKAIDYLLNHIGDDGTVGSYFHGYQQGIVTLALSEAYTMTRLRSIKKKLELCLKCILDAQKVQKALPLHQGGWRYSADAVDSDLSVTGWMAMAIKSCHTAGLDVPREATEGIVSFTKNMYANPGFSYAGSWGSDALSAAGVLLLQYFGEGKSKEVKETLEYLMGLTCDWEMPKSSLYTWYYITLSMFNAGGKYWKYWNKQMQKTIIKNQQADGHWDVPPNSTEVPTYAGSLALPTTFCCLMLEVYYRYMPIYTLVQ